MTKIYGDSQIRLIEISDETRLLDDARVVAASGGGSGPDDPAFRSVYDVYYPRLCGFFGKRIGSSEVHDLTQETFLRVLQGKATIPSIGAFEAWLTRIAKNVHANWVRARKTQKRDGLEQSLDAQDRRSVEISTLWPNSRVRDREEPLDSCIVKEQWNLVAKEIRSLPKKMRQCVLYRHHHGMRTKEIAERMDISTQTVKAHLFQARHRLAAKLRHSHCGFEDIAEDDPK